MVLITADIDVTTVPALASVTGEFFQPDDLVLRWRSTNWEGYSTLPQRILAGQRLFEVLDTDRIYDYYAKLAGLLMTQHMVDVKATAQFADPRAVDDAFLEHLAVTYGAFVDGAQTDIEIREMLRRHGAWRKESGTPAAVVQALEFLGYDGYANHVWVDPQVPPSSAEGYIERPLGYYADAGENEAYVPSSAVSIHLRLRDGTRIFALPLEEMQRIARFLKLTALPAHTFIRFFVGDEWDNAAAVDTPTMLESTVITELNPIIVGEVVVTAATATTAVQGDVT